MTAFFRALNAERLKLRRTLFVWMVMLGPLLVAALYVLVIFGVGGDAYEIEPRAEQWLALMNAWAGFLLPLLVILQMALLANVERQGQQWKHLYALPLPRGAHYAAKWLVAALSIPASTVIVCVLYFLCQVGLNLISGVAPPLTMPVPLGEVAGPLFLVSVAAQGIVALHLWLSLRLSGMISTFAVGAVTVLINMGFLWSHGPVHLWPWSLPFNVLELWQGTLAQTTLLSLAYALVFGMLGGITLTRRDVD